MAESTTEAFGLIRAQLDARYKQACDQLDGVAKLTQALGGDAPPVGNPPAANPASSNPSSPAVRKPSPAKKPSPAPGGGLTVRQRVFAAIADWVDTDAVKKATGLTPKQIRGVLSAKELADKIDRRDTPGGAIEYKLKS